MGKKLRNTISDAGKIDEMDRWIAISVKHCCENQTEAGKEGDNVTKYRKSEKMKMK